MTYTEFYNMFKDYLTGNQIANVQEMAFGFYADAHGYRPMRKAQKQFAYEFAREYFYSMEVDDCIDVLWKIGVPRYKAVEFWQCLEWIKG